MKKVAYLCGEYPRATDTFIRREVFALRNKGFDVSTISIRRPSVREQGTHELESERRTTHYLLPCKPVTLVIIHFALLFKLPSRYFKALKLALTVRSPGLRAFLYQLFYFAEAGLLVQHLKKNGVSHIHNHAPDACGYVAMIASELGGFTYSMTLHGFGIFSEPQKWRLREKIERALFVICISKHGVSQAMLWSERKNWSKIHVVHCGVENKAELLMPNSNGQGVNVLFVGRLDHVKGLPNLIEAIEILSLSGQEIHLHIAGDGPEKNDLEILISEKGLEDQVTMHGYKAQSELKSLYSEADIFVITSFYEGIPVVLMEAMSYGVPVIAPRITGIPELVQDGVSGMLTTPGDALELAESIRILLKDPKYRENLAVEGIKKVQKDFDLNTETERLMGIMQRYLG